MEEITTSIVVQLISDLKSSVNWNGRILEQIVLIISRFTVCLINELYYGDGQNHLRNLNQ